MSKHMSKAEGAKLGIVITRRHAFGDVHIDAADLKVGDVIHHWSSRGGIWTVRRIDSFGVLTLTSDMGAVRRFTPEQIDAKGAWLSHKAPVKGD